MPNSVETTPGTLHFMEPYILFANRSRESLVSLVGNYQGIIRTATERRRISTASNFSGVGHT